MSTSIDLPTPANEPNVSHKQTPHRPSPPVISKCLQGSPRPSHCPVRPVLCREQSQNPIVFALSALPVPHIRSLARFASERLDCVQHPSTTNCTIYRQEYAGPSQRASLTALATATRTTRALIPSKTVLSSPKKNATQAFAPHECWWQRRGCADSLSGPGWRGVGTMPCSLFRQHHET